MAQRRGSGSRSRARRTVALKESYAKGDRVRVVGLTQNRGYEGQIVVIDKVMSDGLFYAVHLELKPSEQLCVLSDNLEDVNQQKLKAMQRTKLSMTPRGSRAVSVTGLSNLRVFISKSEEKRDGLRKFVLYTIDVECGGARWQVKRRFSECDALHKILAKRYPGVDLPLFPSKIGTDLKRLSINPTERSMYQKEKQSSLSQYLEDLVAVDEMTNAEEVLAFFSDNKNLVSKAKDPLTTAMKVALQNRVMVRRSVLPGKQLIEKLQVREAPSVLLWEMKTANYDIGCEVRLNDTVVSSHKRYQSQIKSVQQHVLLTFQGEVQICFDNSYSKMRKKELTYRAGVIPEAKWNVLVLSHGERTHAPPPPPSSNSLLSKGMRMAVDGTPVDVDEDVGFKLLNEPGDELRPIAEGHLFSDSLRGADTMGGYDKRWFVLSRRSKDEAVLECFADRTKMSAEGVLKLSSRSFVRAKGDSAAAAAAAAGDSGNPFGAPASPAPASGDSGNPFGSPPPPPPAAAAGSPTPKSSDAFTVTNPSVGRGSMYDQVWHFTALNKDYCSQWLDVLNQAIRCLQGKKAPASAAAAAAAHDDLADSDEEGMDMADQEGVEGLFASMDSLLKEMATAEDNLELISDSAKAEAKELRVGAIQSVWGTATRGSVGSAGDGGGLAFLTVLRLSGRDCITRLKKMQALAMNKTGKRGTGCKKFQVSAGPPSSGLVFVVEEWGNEWDYAHFYAKSEGSSNATPRVSSPHALVQAAKASARPILLMHGSSWCDCAATLASGFSRGSKTAPSDQDSKIVNEELENGLRSLAQLKQISTNPGSADWQTVHKAMEQAQTTCKQQHERIRQLQLEKAQLEQKYNELAKTSQVMNHNL